MKTPNQFLYTTIFLGVILLALLLLPIPVQANRDGLGLLNAPIDPDSIVLLELNPLVFLNMLEQR